MPLKSFRKKRSTKSKSATGKRKITAAAVHRELKVYKRVNAPEKKECNVSYQNAQEYFLVGASATPTLGPGTAASPPSRGYWWGHFIYPDEGVASNERIGKRIRMSTVQCKVDLRRPQSTALYSGKVRAYLIVDKQPTDGIVEDPVPWIWNLDQNGFYSLSSRIDRYNTKRFRIIGSRLTNFSNTTSSVNYTLYKRVGDVIDFADSNGSSFRNKMFYVVFLAETFLDTAGSNDILPEFAMQSRLRITYTDN